MMMLFYLIHRLLNISLRDGSEVIALGEILMDRAVRVFIQSALPRRIQMREVEVSIQCLSDGFMVRKLFAVA